MDGNLLGAMYKLRGKLRENARSSVPADQRVKQIMAYVLGLWVVSMIILAADQLAVNWVLVVSLGVSMIGGAIAAYSKLVRTEQKMTDMTAAVRSLDERLARLEDRIFSLSREKNRR